tara:strand:+ start:52 stop:876 length:825 start_codon:yes stop_codon:yes gene_type:complete
MKKLIGILFCLSLLSAQSSFVGEQFDRGSINYSDRTIQATGIGFIPENVINAGQARRAALRIAKQDAMRQLIEIVNGVVVTSETTMSNAMFDDVIKSQVQGAIRGARQVGEPRYLSDTSIEVTYEVPMSGISDVITPPTGFLPSTALGTAPATTETSGPTTSGVTGLIIDVRGLGLRPAMSPRILDQNGGVVYGPGNYTREYAIQNGVAGYAKGLEKASADDRVKGNPLVIKGVSASGANKADVVIANADVMKIQSANSAHGVLRDCRVLFVLD